MGFGRGSEFYVKPLMPLFNGDRRFYLLSLKAGAVSFFEEPRYNITEIEVDGLTPFRLDDVAGYFFEQKILHSNQTPPLVVQVLIAIFQFNPGKIPQEIKKRLFF